MTFGEALWASLQREFASIRRSGWDLAMLSLIPLITVVAVASIFFSGVFHQVPIAVVDADHSALSRAIERDLSATPKIRIAAISADLPAASSLMRAGKAYAVIYIPPDLEREAVRRDGGAVVIYFNAAFQTVASQAADAARSAVQAAISANVGPTAIGESASPVRLHPPKVQVTVVGNPEGSFELFLEALAMPLVLNLLLSCASVYAVGRELADGTLSAWNDNSGGRMLAAVIGKLSPYVLVYWLWCIIWTAYLAGLRGWTIQGSPPILLLAQLVFFCATAAISVLLPAVLRKLDLALSLSALYAGSGLSFANATLSLNGSSWAVRAWSAFLPSTSYVRIQEQQWVLNSPPSAAVFPVLALALFIVVSLFVGVRRLARLASVGAAETKLYAPVTPASFFDGMLQTLQVVVRTPPILSTLIFSVILYGFYYPSAYKVQTVVKLPVAVVDLDHSALSRGFIRNLNATRETNVVAQPASVVEAKRLLVEDRVDGVVVVSDGLERGVLRGAPAGISAFLKGAYLVRSRFLGNALGGAVQGSIKAVLAPFAAIARAPATSVETLERPLYNTDNGYGDYAVPGVASVILQATLLFGVAMFMGLKRETEAWRMTPGAFFGAWAAFTLLGSLTTCFFFGFVLWFQDYPHGGDLGGMLVCAPVFCAAVSALGMLIGSCFRRHERSMQILAGTSIPAFFLSGLSWPAFGTPPLVVALAKLLPSTTAVPMFIRLNSMGASLNEIGPEFAIMVLLTVLYGAAAGLRLTSRDELSKNRPSSPKSGAGVSYA